MARFSAMQVCFADWDTQQTEPIFVYRLVEGVHPRAEQGLDFLVTTQSMQHAMGTDCCLQAWAALVRTVCDHTQMTNHYQYLGQPTCSSCCRLCCTQLRAVLRQAIWGQA